MRTSFHEDQRLVTLIFSSEVSDQIGTRRDYLNSHNPIQAEPVS